MRGAPDRFRGPTPGRDIRPGAEPWTFAMQCTVCGVTGPAYRDAERGLVWATRHLAANPGHLDYRQHLTRPYSFAPGAWR